ncbi:MAG: hypothetical protein ACRCYU_12690 [Nocardioides sp.]
MTAWDTVTARLDPADQLDRGAVDRLLGVLAASITGEQWADALRAAEART